MSTLGIFWLVPSVVLCTPLDPTSEAEEGGGESCRLDNPGPPYISCHSIVASPRLHNTEGNNLRVISLSRLA